MSTFAHEYNEYKYITSTRKNVLEYTSTMYFGPNPASRSMPTDTGQAPAHHVCSVLKCEKIASEMPIPYSLGK